MAFDSAGRIIVVGTYQDVVDFDPGSDTKNKNSGGIRGFILKLTKAGNFFAFAQARGGTTSGFSGVDIGEEDTVVAVGFFFNNDEGLLMKLTKRLKR